MRPRCGKHRAETALVWLLVTGCVCLSVLEASAGTDGEKSKSERAVAGGAGDASSVVPDAERVIRFARQHHPELAELLIQLRSAESPEFRRAIRELSGQMQKLDRIRDRTPLRYDYELQSWVLESRTKLLLARWAMSQDPELEQEIRKLLRQRQELRVQQLKHDEEKLSERLEAVRGQLAELTAEKEQRLDEEWSRMSRRAGAKRPGKGNSGRMPTKETAKP